MNDRWKKVASLILWCLFFFFVVFITTRVISSNSNIIQPSPSPSISPTEIIPQQNLNFPTITPEVYSPSNPVNLWLSPLLPGDISGNFSQLKDIRKTNKLEDADISIELGDHNIISKWVYSLVAPFPTTTDNVTSDELMGLWINGSSEDIGQIILTSSTHSVLTNLWGPSSQKIKVVPETSLLSTAWETPRTWAIISFEELEPQWKVISIDGQSPISKSFDEFEYPLVVPVSLSGQDHAAKWFSEHYLEQTDNPIIQKTNRDPSLLTTVLLTGVTALVRGTADMMELKGMTYPAEEIRDFLIDADILHINNEVPFSPKCPPSAQRISNQLLVFCSKPEYSDLLEDIGTDIIELSGDHLQDWGPDAVYYTISLYEDHGWEYYGGGMDIEDAKKPLLIEHNGNKLAFLGCNAKDKGYAGASATNPGAVSCDFDYLDKEIKQVIQRGYIPIVTFQHEEIWSTDPPQSVKEDFYKVALSGAVIASGSQSHQPQTMEFYQNSFLHFGLGNLFFDQIFEGDQNKQAFLDQHVFYNGKYISTELLTTMFVDLAKSRPMTMEEREKLLGEIFSASDFLNTKK